MLYISNASVLADFQKILDQKVFMKTWQPNIIFPSRTDGGEKIFETKTPGQNWDATYKGSKVPIGVYVYMLDFTSIKGKSINSVGIVTVIE